MTCLPWLDTLTTGLPQPPAHTGEEIEQVSTLTAYENSSKQIHPNHNYYIDNELRTLFKLRNRARKIYQYSRNPADKTLNGLQNKIKRKTQSFTQKQWEDKLFFRHGRWLPVEHDQRF
ncbi:hypothetical protein TNCV_4724831 [Trichonephila clavipes]|uniref:Uncharacterized protein n=1 Tax=Trichonephila clavipes TaxID=2585209 RepID=A0A8X7BFE0_TRICX|nr:hypothetical protein TNCV_4724831 [Trichonephila clavipes]